MSLGDKTVYQIYVRSFFDSDGDGVGDLAGIPAKLDYLAWLGVDYLWLNPFFPSPQNDNGYDVSDYCAVDPRFGTMADFERLCQCAAAKGIGIMLDMVFNHSSTEHEWFQKALSGDAADDSASDDASYRDFYFFAPAKPDGGPPSNWVSKFGGSAWEQVPSGAYYLHLFDKTQADLDWASPRLREALFDVLRFWTEKGARGFRFDVVNLISKPDTFEDDDKGDGRRFYTDGPAVPERLRMMRRVIQDAMGDTPFLTVGEMSSTSPEKCAAYSNPETGGLSMAFHFHHLKADYPDGEKWRKGALDFPLLKETLHTWQTSMEENGGWDALFWNNHDQPRALTRFASSNPAYHYHSATMLAAVIHFMRGTPYVYMGEEIGMINPEFSRIDDYRDVETLNYYRILRERGLPEAEVMALIRARSRDNSRTPMQWTADARGFTAGTPWIKAASNGAELNINVEAEKAKPDGILAFYRRLIALRKTLPVIQTGHYQPVLGDCAPLFAYRRTFGGETLVSIHNFFAEPFTLAADRLPLDGCAGLPVLLAANYRPLRDKAPDFSHDLALQPYETLTVLFRSETANE
jgi:trehalose-6-phosphate hydrolase